MFLFDSPMDAAANPFQKKEGASLCSQACTFKKCCKKYKKKGRYCSDCPKA